MVTLRLEVMPDRVVKLQVLEVQWLAMPAGWEWGDGCCLFGLFFPG